MGLQASAVVALIKTRISLLLARSLSTCLRGTHARRDLDERGVLRRLCPKLRGAVAGGTMRERADLGALELAIGEARLGGPASDAMLGAAPCFRPELPSCGLPVR